MTTISSSIVQSFPWASFRALILVAITAGIFVGCNSNVEGLNGSSPIDALTGVTLTNQQGHSVELASLKGEPILFDFFYTSCPGPCLMMTARMRMIANHLGSDLGGKVHLVSVTVDPEHDRPNVLRAYAKQQGAERPGWLFLTGSPAQIDQLMSRFNLKRQREADGTIDHVLEFFLVGPNGHPEKQYLATDVMPAKVAGDLRAVSDGKQLAASTASGAGRFAG